MDDPVLTNYRCLQAPKDTKVPKLKFIVDELVGFLVLSDNAYTIV